MKYYQCKLQRDTAVTIGWIEERGAQVGKTVELKEDGKPIGFWEVVHVWEPGMDDKKLKEKQEKDRNALPSIGKVR